LKNNEILGIKVFVGSGNDFRFIFFQPENLADDILSSQSGSSAGDNQKFYKTENIITHNPRVSPDAVAHNVASAGIDPGYCRTEWFPGFINQHQSLHLGRKGYSDNIGRIDAGFLNNHCRSFRHCIPPIGRFLFGEAGLRNIKRILLFG
jgi:hypothetical protein